MPQEQDVGTKTVGRSREVWAGSVIHTPNCSPGLESRNSCGENYIFKVGLNVFHCWKICHYGHFSPPNSWTAMPPEAPLPHCSLYFSLTKPVYFYSRMPPPSLDCTRTSQLRSCCCLSVLGTRERGYVTRLTARQWPRAPACGRWGQGAQVAPGGFRVGTAALQFSRGNT